LENLDFFGKFGNFWKFLKFFEIFEIFGKFGNIVEMVIANIDSYYQDMWDNLIKLGRNHFGNYLFQRSGGGNCEAISDGA
jgi:hypothetical protein